MPKSSLAEYTEIPGVGTELKVVLSSHPITCESYLPLANDQVVVTLWFSAPNGTKLTPGPYPWSGSKTPTETDVPSEAPNAAPASPSETPNAAPASPSEPPSVHVLPFIRFGKQGRELPAGGHVELTEVRLDAQGAVRGLLRVEQPGSVGLPATSLQGSFVARWCRISTVAANEIR